MSLFLKNKISRNDKNESSESTTQILFSTNYAFINFLPSASAVQMQKFWIK